MMEIKLMINSYIYMKWGICTIVSVNLTWKQTGSSCSQEGLFSLTAALASNAPWKSGCKLPYNCLLFS